MDDAARPQEVFVSYSHHDAEWCQRLFDDYLHTTFGGCRIWTDAQIRVGEAWNEEIQHRLESSTVAVLLVSEHFLASRFVMEHEFPTVLERARSAGLRICWVPIGITREALLARRPELERLQGAIGFDDMLPASPRGCPPATLERVRQHVRQQMLAAVDPVGSELARLVVHRYELERWVGEGNLAAIYRARDRVLERPVVIKVLKDKDQREAFMADVRDAIRTSEEPNFINIYDVAGEQALAYCVTQHVGGKTLAARIAEHPRGLPVQTLRKVFQRITGAIARAHALGITYGNLKPSNIIVDANDEPFILPVGRRRERLRDARHLSELLSRHRAAADAGLPAADADLEDLAYLVPDHFGEQIDPVDPRLSDQYMLGLLAFEMATGQRPLRTPEPQRLLTDGRAAFVDLPPISAHRRLCPERVVELVARMTARSPVRRYADLPTVIEELRAIEDMSLAIARDSYRRCAAAPAFDRMFFERFYDEFLRRCPNARPLFERFRADDWRRLHVMIKEAVLLLFAFRQQGDADAEPNVLSRVAAAHRGVPQWYYVDFVDALLLTVCGDAARELPPFDPECAVPSQRDAVEEHWRAALGPGVDYMRRRAELPPG
ncbi:MAG: TIR domain-containing protein [Rubrivivax sp.]